MAEQIPYTVASSLISRLASAAFNEFGRIYGVVEELERLKNTVESIRAVLLDAEEKQEQNHAVQNWIRRLKDVLYPADDLLDEFFIHEMTNKVDTPHHRKNNKLTEVLHSFSPKQLIFHNKLAQQIEKIRKKFNDVMGDMSLLKLNSNVVAHHQIEVVEWETSSAVLKSDIIGRIDDKRQIISLLQQSHSQDGQNDVSLIAIVGMGGLGKTALAQLIYNDEEVKKSFDKKMWVCVSNNFDVKTIVKRMLESLMVNSKVDDTLSLENLQSKLRENLTGKRYLLILDDIWNESHERWSQLRTHLMCGARDSKVLVTTRSKTVAQTMGVTVSYTLNGLDPIQSWSLLKKSSLWDDSDNSRVNQSLEPIGKEIAKKCKGVPLAIRTLGGLLQGKSKVSEWIGVLQSEFWKLCEDKERSIMPVLKRSYQNLSPPLRQCFSYCSLYPKDWKIQKNELIQLWMAQGYLECSVENQSMEDVGNEFVKILLMKSFFQDAEMSEWGDIVSFKMHDLMHDLAMQVAGNDCCYLDSGTKALVGRPMHVSLEHGAIELLSSLDASRLRTLILLSFDIDKLSGEEMSVISKFKHLRVLKLKGFSLRKMAGSFKKLKHLRCLILLDCLEIESLFKSITTLVSLQTLILRRISETVKFSTQDLSKLINLIYLNIWFFKESEEKKMTGGFGKLSLGNYYWLSSFTNIVEIRLYMCAGIQHLPPLEHLPFLKSLTLYFLIDLEYIYYEETHLPAVTFFRSLEHLTFFQCRKLRGWWRIGDSFNDDNNNSSNSHHHPLPPFTCLSLLSIHGCPMLNHMPTFPRLDKKLKLVNCSLEILNTAFDFPPFSMLNSLYIGGLALDVRQFPNNWVQNLTSLRDLQIYDFSSQQIQEIGMLFKDGLNCLHKITFLYCSEVKTLPDWMFNLSSLQHIKVDRCGFLTSLPEGMAHLTNLHTLEVIDSTLLAEEFLRETGEFWPRISHIRNIILDSSLLSGSNQV